MTDTPGEYKIRFDLIGVFGAKSSYLIKIFLKDRAGLNKRKSSFDFSNDYINGTNNKIIKVKFRIT